jgi:hypothetical protein
MNKIPISLRDFLYFDSDKAASIFSQLSGGLITGIETRAEDASDQRNIRQYDLKIFKPEFGGVTSSTQVLQESRVLHHDLFSRIEQQLFEGGYAVDISQEITAESVGSGAAHERLHEAVYVRVEGWSVIEDYERMKNIATRYNRIADFISHCTASALEEHDGFRTIQQELEAARARVAEQGDRNKRAREERALARIQERFQQTIREISGLSGIAPWLVEGMGEFIETFMPDRINFRVYPFVELPEFNIMANLRRSCFVDANIENLLFAYGSRPNVKLTMFGLVTSLPSAKDEEFDPMAEFISGTLHDSTTEEQRQFEEGFRGVFRGFRGFENMVRYSRYPNVTVYPIAVYRDIRAAKNRSLTSRESAIVK